MLTLHFLRLLEMQVFLGKKAEEKPTTLMIIATRIFGLNAEKIFLLRIAFLGTTLLRLCCYYCLCLMIGWRLEEKIIHLVGDL
jgi:hypothetical protein